MVSGCPDVGLEGLVMVISHGVQKDFQLKIDNQYRK
jgi:hypothetical protein